MIFSYNWLQSFFKKKLPKPEKLAEILTMHSFEVKGIKKVKNDWILDIDVLPNRAADCFSHLGVARECGVLTNSKLKTQNSKPLGDKKLKAKDFVLVEVKNKVACPRYTARVVTNVKVKPSPKWIQDRLKVCGLRPINNIVDIANFVMLETGQPLHAFDGQKLAGKKIVVRFAKKGEKIVTLDDEKYVLDENILVIADSEKPVAIAGIKGGKIPEIDKKTNFVVLESANFNPIVIRHGSKRLNLITDASRRFEHGIDPNLTEIAINRAAFLIQEITKGKVAQGLVDFYPKKVQPKKIKSDLNYVESLLGIKISAKEIKNILAKLEFKIAEVKLPQIVVEVPTLRLDIRLAEDLIEEIGRIYGYNKIIATFPLASLVPPKKNFEIFWEDSVKDILKEVGFSEIYNYSFIGEKDAEIFSYKTEEMIEVENPVSVEQKYLRPSLVPNLLKNAKNNLRYYDEMKIFEIGKIFKNAPNLEKRAIAGLFVSKNPSQKDNEFYYLKGVIDTIFNKLGISNVWYDAFQPTPEESKITIWNPQRCAEIKINQEELGFLGEISPSILKSLKIKEKVIIFDIDFEKLIKLCSEEHQYRPISQYPAAVRDLAVLVPIEVRVEEVLNKIEIAGGILVRDVDLFDIYEGEELPEGKKNLAFHIIYQSEEKTLSSEEIEKIHNKIIKEFEKEQGWQVRR